MHVDAANQVPVSFEATLRTGPVSAFGFVAMAAYRTPGARSPLRPGEARYAGLFTLVRQIVDVLAILPLTHALIVFPAATTLAHAIRIADEQAGHGMGPAELDHLTRSFMPQVSNATFATQGMAIPGSLQLLPAP